jgi:sugar phosphate isomerase/epimerase
MINRRRFIQSSLLSATVASLPAAIKLAVPNTGKDPYRGLKMGVASYSLRKFSLDEALAMTQKLGVRYITLKDCHLLLKSSQAERQETRRKIATAGLILMGGGVIYMRNDEAEIRNAFEYAKDAGMPTVVASPEPQALDKLDKMVNEYQIRVAIHNHGPGDEKYPAPQDVFNQVKNHDPRIGLCIDIGHTVRIGSDPVEAIRRYSSRLYDVHFKDVTAAAASGECIELGKGMIDIVGVLKALLDIRYSHHVALEYEINETNPMMGMAECFGYARGALAAMR